MAQHAGHPARRGARGADLHPAAGERPMALARVRAHGTVAAHRTAVLPEQAALRRPGRLRALPVAGAGRLGHRVEVFSGQPYPELDDGVPLTEVPSLDLYREPDPFRTPRPSEFRDWVDVAEWATMCTAGFPEPLTFSLRAARLLLRPGRRVRRRPRQPVARVRPAPR